MIPLTIKDKFRITERIIKQSLGYDSFEKGLDYQNTGMVDSAFLNPKLRRLEGTVLGNFKPHYHVKVKFDGTSLDGTCSCPVGSDCKHCAALCLEWIYRPGNFGIVGDTTKQRRYREDSKEDDNDGLQDETGDEDEDDNPNEMIASNNAAEDAIDHDGDELGNEDEDEIDAVADQIKHHEIHASKENNESRKKGKKKPRPSIRIPPDLLLTQNVPTNEIVDAISLEAYKILFVSSWCKQFKEKEPAFFGRGAIFSAWKGVIMDMDYYDLPNTGDYDPGDVLEDGARLEDNLPFTGWIGPFELLQLVGDFTTRKKLLQTWFEDFINLGELIWKEFDDRGLVEGNDEKLVLYYDELIRNITVIDDDDDNDDFYYHGHHDYHDDDDDLDEEEIDIDEKELKIFSENFLKRIALPIIDIARFHTELFESGLSDHASFLREHALQWVVDLPSTLPRPINNLEPGIAVLKARISEEIERPRIDGMPLEDRVAFRVDQLVRLPSEEMAALIMKDCDHALEPGAMVASYHDLLSRAFNDHATGSVISCWLAITGKYRLDLLFQAMETIVTKPNMKSWFRTVASQFYEILGLLEPEQVSAIQESFLHNMSSATSSKKKGMAEHQEDLDVKHALVEALRWLSKYYKTRHAPGNAINVLSILAKNHSNAFVKDDFKRLEACIEDAHLNRDEILTDFFEMLKKRCDPHEMLPIFVASGRLADACSILLREKDQDLFSRFLPGILLENPAIEQDTIMRLLDVLKKDVYSMVDHPGGQRHDHEIADLIDCVRLLFQMDGSGDGPANWFTWFKQFWNKHHTLRNLKRALEEKGLLLKKNGPSKK